MGEERIRKLLERAGWLVQAVDISKLGAGGASIESDVDVV
eukprot:gene3442-13652_t